MKDHDRPAFGDGDIMALIFGLNLEEVTKTKPKVAPEAYVLDPDKYWLLNCSLASL